MATSESGMVSRLISAIRHSKRNSARMTTTRMNPITSAWVRLEIASLTKLACWNTLVSNLIPGSPGSSCRIASSTPAVICRLFAQGSFSTTSSSPGWPSMIASPISGWWSSATLAMSPSRTCPGPSEVTGTLARSAGVTIGSTLRMPIRWFGVSMVPPVPITAPVENLSRPESTASAVASITFSSETCRACILVGSAWTVMSWSRSFQMATLATPGTRSSRALIVQYAVIDISMSEWFFDVMPICMARPVAETGASMTGGAAQVGRLGDDRRDALLHQLARPEQVGARLEQQLDRGQLRNRLGPHVVQALDAVQPGLERHGDELLDVGGGQAHAGGLDDHPGRGELGEDVDVHLRQRGDAQDHQADGGRDDQVPELQARADDRPHQGPPGLGWHRRRPPRRFGSVHSSPLMLYSVPSSSAAPTVTTGVPAAARRTAARPRRRSR